MLFRSVVFSAAQKKQLAELDAKFAAKIAGRELALKDEIRNLVERGEFEKAEQLEQQLVIERKKLQAELEEKKNEIRRGSK